MLMLSAVAMAVALLAAVPAVAADTGGGALGEFEGQLFDMSDGWGDATACWVGEDSVARCFSSEAEMDRRIADELAVPALDAPMAAESSCSGYLKMYDYTGFAGPVLYLTTRLEWLNLTNYGFNQKASSYKIGPCSATFADLADGAGARYPTYLTEAYDQSSSMLSGWDNDVSSVYIR